MSYTSEVLADSPRGYWRMNEASGLVQDSSGNGNHATASGGTPTYGGVSPIISDATAKSIGFDGSTEYFSVPDHATLDLGDTFSLEAWVKAAVATPAGVNYGIVSKQAGAYYMRIYETGQLELIRSATADIAWSDAANVDDTSWHHVVVTKAGATIALYVDANDETGSSTNSTCANNASALIIGADTTTADRFNGNLAEVAVYPTALTLARVSAHYVAATTIENQPLSLIKEYPQRRFGPF